MQVETAGYACVYILIEGKNLKSQLMNFEVWLTTPSLPTLLHVP